MLPASGLSNIAPVGAVTRSLGQVRSDTGWVYREFSPVSNDVSGAT